MPVNSPTLYRPSGKLGSLPILAPILLLVAIPIVSAIYAYIDAYLMWLKTKTLISVLYAFAIMGLVGLFCEKARCRSPLANRMVALAAGVFALYFTWVVFAYALLDRWNEGDGIPFFEILLNPTALWTFVQYIGENGWFSYHDDDIKGGLIWTIWACEAALVICIPLIGVAVIFKDNIFCEACGTWMKAVSSRATFAPLDDPHALKALEAGSVTPLEALEPVDPAVSPQYSLDTWDCHKCGQTHGFRLRHVWQTANKKGQVSVKQKPLTGVYLLDPESHQRVAAVCARQAELPEAQPGQNSEEPQEA